MLNSATLKKDISNIFLIYFCNCNHFLDTIFLYTHTHTYTYNDMRGAPANNSTDIDTHQIRNSVFLDREKEGRRERDTVFVERLQHLCSNFAALVCTALFVYTRMFTRTIRWLHTAARTTSTPSATITTTTNTVHNMAFIFIIYF